MIGQLTILNGPLRGAIFPLPTRGIVLLGQCLYNDIQLPDRALATSHCAFVRGTEQDEDQYLLIDLHTQAGTRVNDVRVAKAELHDGSLIAIGDSRLRFDALGDQPRGPQPLPPDGAIALLDASKRQRRRARAALHSSGAVQATIRPLRGVSSLDDHTIDPATPLYFGRGRGAHVVLTDPGSSRHQCLVTYDVNTGQFVLYDLHTTNGTLLNDEPVQCSPLHDRDAIQIGRDTEFRFLETIKPQTAENLDETRDLTHATMIVRRGKKKKKAPDRARRHAVRPEPKIHHEDTAIQTPVQAKAHPAPKPRRKHAPPAPPPASNGKPAKPGRETVALPVADGTAVSSLFAEAYRTLRTNLDVTAFDGQGKCIIVTSPGPQEGKTCIAINLAIAAANVGLRVLLLEGDLRRSRLHRVLLVDARPGLVNFLANGTTVNGHIKETSIHNLWLLPRGSRPANPAELLNSETLADLLEELRTTYDLIVVDTPPLLSVADASVLSPLADGYLLVLRARKTPRDAAKKAIQQIEHVGGKVLGVVLNDVNPKEQRYRYYHRYAY